MCFFFLLVPLPSLLAALLLPRDTCGQTALGAPCPSAADPPHDGTDITRQVPAAGSGGEILLGVQPVSVNHEISISQVAEERQKDEQEEEKNKSVED